jgi:hypothetical protein
MTLDINRTVVLQPDYLLERIDDEITVYHPSLTTSLYLNETGALIWELCDGKRKISDIIGIIIELYPESRDQIQRDVVQIISSLVENNIALLRERAPGKN